MVRVVRFWYSPYHGESATTVAQISARSSSGTTDAYAQNTRARSRTTTSGLALRLWYHAGFFGPPPNDATRMRSPSCGT